MQPGVTYRKVGAQDGAKIAALGEQTPDTGAVAFHNLWQHDPYASILALHHNAVGVVAEASGHDGIVGMGMMSTGECHYEGALRPFAYLFSLSVHPDYRRRGIASQLAAWRVNKAREMLGEDAVIFAGIQQGNEGSLRNAAKWINQRVDGRTTAVVDKMRSSPPQPVTGFRVRPAEAADYEEIAEKQNAFYAPYNLYPPRTAEALRAWHQVAPFGTPIRDYLVVTDQDRNIVAGLSATGEGLLTTGHVTRMALPIRLLNTVVKVIPADGIAKRIHVKDLWFAPGHMDAAKYLWESLRWLWRERGTMLMVFYDAKSPLAQIVSQPWYMPRQTGSLVVAAPMPMSEAKSIYMHI
jgi:GNAT superfamily N-acetyltransferase